VLLIGNLYERESAPFEQLAAALETLHTATLIHDDVIDEAALRRGHPTLHSAWSTARAVLGGDFLLAEAVAMTAALDVPRLVQILADTLRAMCAGEIRESLTPAPPVDLRQAYYETIQAKSASLFAGAAEMAGVLAEASQPQVAALRAFGWEMGTAFQMIDDILDLTSPTDLLGKDSAADLRQGLVTLPTLIYLETAEDPSRVQSVLDGSREQEHVAAAVRGILASGAIEAASTEAFAHAARARAALTGLPDTRWRRLMQKLLTFAIERGR
jgi:geranylgeranyl pyrophosphate synthase